MSYGSSGHDGMGLYVALAYCAKLAVISQPLETSLMESIPGFLRPNSEILFQVPNDRKWGTSITGYFFTSHFRKRQKQAEEFNIYLSQSLREGFYSPIWEEGVLDQKSDPSSKEISSPISEKSIFNSVSLKFLTVAQGKYPPIVIGRTIRKDDLSTDRPLNPMSSPLFSLLRKEGIIRRINLNSTREYIRTLFELYQKEKIAKRVLEREDNFLRHQFQGGETRKEAEAVSGLMPIIKIP